MPLSTRIHASIRQDMVGRGTGLALAALVATLLLGASVPAHAGSTAYGADSEACAKAKKKAKKAKKSVAKAKKSVAKAKKSVKKAKAVGGKKLGTAKKKLKTAKKVKRKACATSGGGEDGGGSGGVNGGATGDSGGGGSADGGGGGTGDAGGGSGGAGSGDGGEIDSFPQPSNPRSISPILDHGRAVTRRVTTAGDTLEATGANGSRYTLTLPPDSLLAATEITMTPVASIPDLPLSGGLIGAVDLEPHGLQLMRYAELLIEPPPPVPVAEQIGFGAYEGGEDFHHQPLGLRDGKLTRALSIPLQHFSTAGAGTGSSGDWAAAIAHMPVRAEAQYTQEMAERLARARKAELAGAEEEVSLAEDLVGCDPALAYFRDVVRPAMARGETDDSYAVHAIGVWLSWERSLQLFGAVNPDSVQPTCYDPASKEAEERAKRIVANAYRLSVERCIENHDLSEVARLLAFGRMIELLGGGFGSGGVGDWEGDRKRCARFELDWESKTTMRSSTEVYRTDGRATKIPINPLEGEDWREKAMQPREVTRWQITHPYPCTQFETLHTEPQDDVRVLDIDLDYNVTEKKQKDGQIIRTVPAPKISLRFSTGLVWHHYRLRSSCDSTPGDWLNVYADWLGVVWALAPHHAAELDGEGGFVISDWSSLPPGSGRLLARKTYDWSGQLTDEHLSGTEQTSFDLWHAPKQ